MPTATSPQQLPADRWLFTPAVDLAVFLGSAILSLALLALGAQLGILRDETPDWAWVPFILLIDVAHVYSTAFRVYFDADELRRRPRLYFGVPIAAFLCGAIIYQAGELVFWRVLAYLAVFHFVRQQYGWVAMYRAKLGERSRLTWWIDALVIYLATIYPLVFWHANLPRRYWWFVEGDFLLGNGRHLLGVLATMTGVIYAMSLVVYAIRSAWAWRVGRANPGKDIVVLTTAVCWYVGIVTFNSDYAFTVTNVIIHGVPYIALIYWYVQAKRRRQADSTSQINKLRIAVTLIATVWLFAYVEELIWDRAVWQERGWLFGSPVDVGSLGPLLIPLLAVPQLTHYILDGFIWKRRSNPDLRL